MFSIKTVIINNNSHNIAIETILFTVRQEYGQYDLLGNSPHQCWKLLPVDTYFTVTLCQYWDTWNTDSPLTLKYYVLQLEKIKRVFVKKNLISNDNLFEHRATVWWLLISVYTFTKQSLFNIAKISDF